VTPRDENQANIEAVDAPDVCSKCLKGGAQGQNRTADTGIFNVNKINNLLILLAQAIRGTVRQNHVDSIACVSLAKTAKFRRCTADVPRIRRKPIRNFYQQALRIQPSRRWCWLAALVPRGYSAIHGGDIVMVVRMVPHIGLVFALTHLATKALPPVPIDKPNG